MQQPHVSRAPARPSHLLSAACASLLFAGTVQAEDATIEGIVIGTYQHAGQSTIAGQDVKDEFSGAIDLSISAPLAGGALEVEVKGATTPITDGVSSVLPEANASVGETLDNNDEGRIVAWQLFYRHDVGAGSLAGGLIDVSGWIDGNDVASDEFTQFMGTSFLHNPTIDMPAATLGMAYNAGLGGGFGLAAVLSNAAGIEPCYRCAFDLGRDGNGAFAALEGQWAGNSMTANLGYWTNTRKHDTDGDGIDDDRLSENPASGVYGNLSGGLGKGQWNLRAGWADPKVQAAAGFLGLAYSYPLDRVIIGAGVSQTYASDELTDPHSDLTQAEIYGRMEVAKGLTITADLQHIAHSGFDPTQDGTWVVGTRMGVSF
jgi:hypothetical protein